MRHLDSVIRQKRSTLPILRDNSTPSSKILARCHGSTKHEQQSTNNEGLDPLNLENGDLGQELTNSGAECKHGKSKADGGILEGNEVESAIGKDTPDEDVADDASREAVRMVVGEKGASTDPVESDKGPRKRKGKSGGVDEEGGAWVAEITDSEVEEVDDNQEEREPEVAASPKMNETEQEKVRGDVVGRNVAGSS